jgi:hypothetical protein
MATLVDLIRIKVKDDSGKLTDPDDLISAATEALNRYSKARPLEVVVDIPGTGGTHDVDLPIDWIEGFSTILQVEYPVDQVPARIIPRHHYLIYSSPTGKKLRVMVAYPTAAEMVRQTYTILHSEDSVPAVDLEAVANLAASICLRQLAAAYGQTSDSTIQADTVNYRSKADEFRRLADSFEGLYRTHLGIKDNDTVPAASTVAGPPERDYGFAGRRRR